MKTSNQLLIGLLAIIFIALFSTNMVLKSEYEKIDRQDPLYGYSKENISPFKVVKLQGNYQGLVEIIPGDSFEIRVGSQGKGNMQWEVTGDTLLMTHPYENLPAWFRAEQTIYWAPAFYITTPQLGEVHVRGITCKLSGWQQKELQLVQEGKRSGMLLAGNVFDVLRATVTQGSFLQLATDNQIQYAHLTIQDSSTLITQSYAIDSLNLNIDSTAFVKLPGSLLSKLAF